MENVFEGIILGGGVTGLAAGASSGWPVFEAAASPGGLCASYSLNGYRFEPGGGHWIFGASSETVSFLERFAKFKSYRRRASIYLSQEDRMIPYPIQHHFPQATPVPSQRPETLAGWLESQFNPELMRIFFAPFHERYTAGLWASIAAQDIYKTAKEKPFTGYNSVFLYPEKGLGSLSEALARQCRIHFGKKALRIHPARKTVEFEDGSRAQYGRLISTLPLDKTCAMAGIAPEVPADPYTSVLVLNIGAVRGPRCPSEHWVYTPASSSGFHRIGFYSNVDEDFLPQSARLSGGRAGLYVEKAYLGGRRPSSAQTEEFIRAALRELKEWGFIQEAEVIDPSWIETAYTWSWPQSSWREDAIRMLARHDIIAAGRYARWKFQGIAESIQEGLSVGSSVRREALRNF